MAFELFPVVQWFDNSGNPLAGGLISTFLAGTTTPQATYTDSTGGTPQANPVVLDSAGRAQIWFAAASYKLVLKTSAGVTLMTIDNVTLDNLAATISSLSMTGNLTMQQSTAATSGANQSSNTYSLQGNFWNGSVSGADQWQFQDVLGTGSNPTATLAITHSGSSGAATIQVPNITNLGNETIAGTLAVTGSSTLNGGTLNGSYSGNPTLSGNVTAIAGQNIFKAYSFNTVLWVDGIKYTTLAAAYADLPSTGGVVMVPPNYSETLAASITCSKAYSGFIFCGPATINAGAFQFIVTAGVHGCFIGSWVPFGSSVISDPSGVEWKYTGTGNAFLVGGSGSDTRGLRINDIAIYLNNAGSAAVGLDVVRTLYGRIDNLKIIGSGGAVTQQGIILDGTGNYTGLTIVEPIITGVLKGIQLTGSGVNAGNANKIIGGQIGSPATGTSIGIDFQATSGGNSVIGTDVENHAIGYNIAGSSQGNYLEVRSESCTSGCTLGASTTQNEVHLINTTDPFTDSGTNNLIFTSGGTMHGATLQGVSSSNAVTLLNLQDVVGPLTGNAADQTIFTYTLPGKTMAAGKGIRVKVWWIHGTGTASVTYKLSFGASAVVNSASAVTGNGYAEAVIMNQPGSTTGQRASSQFSPTGTAAVIQSGLGPAETTTSNVTVKFTFNVANTDQVTGAQWVVELIQ